VFRPLLLSISLFLLAACSREPQPVTLSFWAMGSEGEAVERLLPEFERRHPGLRVKVQQIPWSAAHEKLLTAYAGDALPDLFQLGNTWLPEFVALDAIESLDGRLRSAAPFADFFAGILDAVELDGRRYGLPWYVDTRLLFYRKDILAAAGFSAPPTTWEDWQAAMARIKALPGEHEPLLLPMNEWQVPIILGLQRGAGPLREGGRYGNFRSEGFRAAFLDYIGWFRQGYAPAVATAQIANLYREFGRGRFAMYITGPWNIGEFRRRLPAEVQDSWATAPLPAPPAGSAPSAAAYPGLSLAGGASLVLSRSSRRQEASLALMEFLLEPERQVEFHRLTGDLPSRRSAWESPELAGDEHARAFREQLEQVAATPKIPEWERIADKVAHYAEKAVRGEVAPDAALAALDADVDRILEKRRWLLEREQGAGGGPSRSGAADSRQGPTP
jgi:multiple sugar transport system substrate-binding protein